MVQTGARSACASGQEGSATGKAPSYIAIAHAGLTLYAFTSSDGINWTMIPGLARDMAASTLVGLAVSSVNNATVSTTTFDSVSVVTNGANVCPTGWACQDIGSPSPAGYQDYLGNGSWVIYGSGADIWGTSDQFHYVSQALPGDGTLSTRVSWQANTRVTAKSGLMVRASNAANAPFYYVIVEPSNTIYVVYRDTAGGSAAVQTSISGAIPVYLKIGRSGTTYTAYTSSDGTNWTAIAGSSRTMRNLSGTVQIGLAVASHSAGVLGRAVFDKTSITMPPPNTVTITPLAEPTGVTSYPIQTAYNDASMPTSLIYSDNEVASYGYDSGSAWLTSLSTTPAGGSVTTLLDNIAHNGWWRIAGMTVMRFIRCFVSEALACASHVSGARPRGGPNEGAPSWLERRSIGCATKWNAVSLG